LTSESSAADVALGDVDADGRVDVVIANVYGGNALVLSGGGGFLFPAASPLPPGSASAVALGDVDGDADVDAYWGVGTANVNVPRQDRLDLNDGSGGFTDATGNLPLEGNITDAVALFDADADGDLDVFRGNDGGQPDGLFRNDGSGVFAEDPVAIPPDNRSAHGVAIGDVDGDLDLDVFVGNGASSSTGSTESLLLNGGSGSFADGSAALPANADWTNAVAMGDVDGDGDLDLLGANGGTAWSPTDRLYLNVGGAFVDGTPALGVDSERTYGALLEDVDGDVDLDLFFANASPTGRDRLLRNDGGLAFTDVSGQALPQEPFRSLAARADDLDGDGDRDIVLLDYERHEVLLNVGRQLSWRALPRVGKTLAMDVFGTPGGGWILLASISVSPVQTSYGTLQLAPPLFVMGSGVLDAQGHAVIAFAVPRNPLLAGLALYWQSLEVYPPRLTNLEVTTLTAF
jgi:hypothetical protein